ncbi:hypothetical protein CDD80_2348 [Ophiocordyceps camponoti-rufipedis]|uniref:C2H2-type domain-containing protein n=1 Tax=Ophiocordyceps camponoti-rufipedis TaxID=2004952 RepID=A0A2C5YBM7_9HYPO|nr:hypothetical protein CDD80_2348 [Ophiocordyceps camponoti-rufipedis]
MSPFNPRRRPATPDADDLPKLTMSLRKSATFHSPPISPIAVTPDDDFNPPSLCRSQTSLDDVVDDNHRRIAMALNDIDETLSQSTCHPSPYKASPVIKSLQDNSLPFPPCLLHVAAASRSVEPMALDEPWVSRRRQNRRPSDQDSDSGLGSSVASTVDKCSAADKLNNPMPAIMGSQSQMLPALRQRAYNKIMDRIFRPLLARADLKDFRPVVTEIPRRVKSKDIVCLRDLEKTLIFMAPKAAKTASLYLKFCMSSIRCIQATFEHLPEREQIRPGDRPYTNGYFIDLREQILEYGKQLRAAREAGAVSDTTFDPNDQVKLFGGVADNGRPAELVRVKKDGTAISMATGQPVDMSKSPAQFKRSLSEQHQDDEEIMRSMARRKKNASLEELAPKRCSEPGCHKVFKRPCDLTKHEKTHSRPWKCPIVTCKYHEFGWPTEKEMDRHVNDKHSSAPAMYECMFTNCPYKSKRESNCKQHMEKAHGWHYARSKTNGKKTTPKLANSMQQTPTLGNESTPSTTPAYSAPTPPLDQELMPRDFSMFPGDADYRAAYGLQGAEAGLLDMGMDNAVSAVSYDQYPPYQESSTYILRDEDIYAARVQLPAQAPAVQHHVYHKMIPQQLPIYSGLQPSHAQVQQQAPAPQVLAGLPFSAITEASAALFSPDSMLDEGFDESYQADGNDFQLFPVEVNRGDDYRPLFESVPSANLGLSQNSQPDIFEQMEQMEWAASGYAGFQ